MIHLKKSGYIGLSDDTSDLAGDILELVDDETMSDVRGRWKITHFGLVVSELEAPEC